jgi:multisubunit Na+/H+ antiporter MnhG subunit
LRATPAIFGFVAASLELESAATHPHFLEIMKAFFLIVAALLLPFAAIGSFTAASLLLMRDGTASGSLPTLLNVTGVALIFVLAACIVSLHKLHVAKKTATLVSGT